MRIEYLYAEDCPICMGMKKEGVTPTLDRLFVAFRDIYFVQGVIDEIGDGHYAMEDGSVTRKPLIVSPIMQQIVDRREDGYSGLGTPMMHLVDPISGNFDEVFIADMFESAAELQETLAENPWMMKRKITRRIFRFYLRECVDIPEGVGTTHSLRKALEPEMERGEFQIGRWHDAFRRAQEPAI